MTTSQVEAILELFRLCLGVRQGFNRIDTLAARIQVIAMNGSVVAGHTGLQVRVFGEIAHQLEIGGRRLKNDAGASLQGVDRATNLILKCLVVERLIEKYRIAQPSIKGSGNQKLVESVMTQLLGRIRTLLAAVPAHLALLESKLKNLLSAQYRLYSTYNKLCVEATELSGSQAAAIGELCDNLEEALELGIAAIQELAALVDKIRGEARRAAQRTHGEAKHAQICAA